MGDGYWQSAAQDEAMQEEHGFLWEALVEAVDVDLAGARVLDAGCNRGGFLRMLVDRCGIGAGYGYDPATAAVEDARRLAGGRPLTFAAADTVPAGWDGFDVAFSHEVLYLLRDLPSHARAVFDALRPGGVYFAVIGVHAGSALMREFHARSAAELDLPELYDIDEVVQTFASAGFAVAAARLPVRFVPLEGHGHHDHGSLLDWLDYYHEQKLVLRLTRPSAG